MTAFEQKVTDVIQHFNNNDTDLGYRRLIDCVLDVNELAISNQCIALQHYKVTNPTNEDWKAKCIAFLRSIQHKNIANNATNTNETLLVKATDISKRYSSGLFALGPINVQIHKGNIIGLVGENGNGKTTLLRILAKDLSFDEGVLGFNFAKGTQTDYSLKSKLIYIPQRTPTWYGKVIDNLKLTATHYGIKGDQNEALVLLLIMRFGLWRYKDSYWSELSSGYKMRFELVRTFLRQPAVLFLDEPLANLDVLAQQLILEDLKYMAKSIRQPIGIILSSQVLYEVEKISDEVVFLKNGKQQSFNKLKEDKDTQTVYIELETDSAKEAIVLALQNVATTSIQLNGGTYTIEATNTSCNAILQELINANVTIKYSRDITYSTRRLFN